MRAQGVVLAVLAGWGCGRSQPPVVAASAPATQAPAGPPRARTVDVTDTQFGTAVPDPYRWMEGNDNPELTAWLTAQGDWTRSYLARIPGRDALLARVRELGNSAGLAGETSLVAGKLFYVRTAPGEQLHKIMMLDGGKPRVIAEPATFQTTGGHVSIDAFAVSPDGNKLAANVSTGGGETATVHVIDLATGAERADRVERVTGVTAVTWLPDSSGFLYTQKVVEGPGVDPMLHKKARLHVLGTTADQDTTLLAVGVGDIPIAPNETVLAVPTRSARWMMLMIAGARSEARYVIAPVTAIDRAGAARTPWQAVAGYDDGVADAVIQGDRVYLRSYKDASNFRIVSVSAAHPDFAAARVEIAEDPSATLVDMAAARDALYVVTSVHGRAHLLRWAWRGQPIAIELPFDGWINSLATDPARDGVVFGEEGWTHPPAFYRYEPGKPPVAIDALATETSAGDSGVVADEIDAPSLDGTRVPLSVIHRKDIAHDGARPTIVSGYGGYGVSQTPSFSPSRLAWLERGGVIAVCHVRGGGENGEAWHVDGARERKINGVHDFEACAQALIAARLTGPAHLFADGGSMGGVLIGRAITDRPDLFAGARIAVGIVNPLRLNAAKNGATQFAEVGDPATESGFRSLLAMDPYQHVATAAYPATIFTIGLNDPRVSPWMTGKMAARMQAMTTSGKPVAIRVERDAGHGFGSTRDQSFRERADVWSFFLAASGDPDFAPR